MGKRVVEKIWGAAFVLLLCLSIGTGSAAPAKSPSALSVDNPLVQAALAFAEGLEPATIEEQIRLCEIPAPPFGEEVRGLEYRRLMDEIGLKNVRIDEVGNVLGEWGSADGPVVVLSAHLDTVYPEGTDVTIARQGTNLKGPGIVDDCRGLAVVLAAARTLVKNKVEPEGLIIFVGTVGEEGAGNLRGVRHLFEQELKGRVDYFISVDGAGYDLTHDAVGSHRYRVIYTGPGGHSYGAFGMPSPIHALGRAIAKIADFQVPSDPKVTFNVGVIEGGTSVNSIAFEASMDVDMRAVDPSELGRLDSQFQKAVQQALEEENGRWNSSVKLTVEIETIGIRPAGKQSEQEPIVKAAVQTASALGIQPRLTASSTDANIPISLGIPSVTMDGGGTGKGAHSPGNEAFDSKDSHRGTQWAVLLVLSLAGMPN